MAAASPAKVGEAIKPDEAEKQASAEHCSI
jgi:hypothetical protein